MGSHPTAKLAWGIDFGDPENTVEGYTWNNEEQDSWEFEHEVMPGLLGFTEAPPERPDGLEGTALHEWFDTVRKPYNKRFEAGVPLTFTHYGYEYGGTALILKRSLHDIDWGCIEVDPTVIAGPTPDELAAFNTVLNHLGYDGGPVRLLLMSLYG